MPTIEKLQKRIVNIRSAMRYLNTEDKVRARERIVEIEREIKQQLKGKPDEQNDTE